MFPATLLHAPRLRYCAHAFAYNIYSRSRQDPVTNDNFLQAVRLINWTLAIGIV